MKAIYRHSSVFSICVGIIGGLIAGFIIKMAPKNYLLVILCLCFVYCLYSLIAFGWMPKDFTNKYFRIYRKYVKLFSISAMFYILCWLLWYKGESISKYVISITTSLGEPLVSIILIVISVIPLILGIIASVLLALYVLEGGALTWMLPFVILKKHNRHKAIASVEEKWRVSMESYSQRQKFLLISIIILCLSIPLMTIIVILVLLTFSK
jgi:hypothetical protein